MRFLQSRGIRSIIVTSGTLSPLNDFIVEMGMFVDYIYLFNRHFHFRKFPIVLESDHVVASNQVLAAIIRNGPQKASLNGSFNNRYDC